MTSGKNRSFWALIATQFFGAFNDNLFKVVVSALVVSWVVDPAASNQLVALGTAVFAAPFLLFSMAAGRLSDRMSKTRVMVATKFWEVLVVAAAVLSLWLNSIPLMMASLFLLALQSTVFSPAKYGVLPEMMARERLSWANAWLNIGTFAAILLGTFMAGGLAADWVAVSWVMCLAAVLGLASSLLIKPLPAVRPDTPLAWNPLAEMASNWRVIRQDRPLRRSILAVNYFWFMGAAMQANVFLYARQMDGTPDMARYMILAILVGIGAGSYAAARLSAGKVELGLVPLGCFGMGVFALDLLFAVENPWRAYADLFFLGAFAGLYDIPLMAQIQARSPEAHRGRVLATSNFLTFVAIALSAGMLWILGTGLELTPAQVCAALGLFSFIGTAVICVVIPEAPIRLALVLLTKLVYRIRVVGRDNVPATGPALLVANHLSMVDGFLIGASVPRLIRFLIWRVYYQAKAFHWLLRPMKAIPISEKDPPKQILKSLLEARKALEEGHLVCIFAEGQISRTGNLLEFKKGFEVIVKDLEVPVIPVHLDRVWGSIFSFEHGKVIWKKPRRLPYPVTVTFGPPVQPPIGAANVRQAVMDLSADAFTLRLEEMDPLPLEFLKRAKRQPSAFAVADSSGVKMSFGRLAALAKVLAESLRLPSSPNRESIGLLLPPSVGGVIANVAASLLGKIPVNLNYTAGSQAVDHAIQKAGITHVITSRKLLEKTGLELKAQLIYVEDMVKTLPKARVLWELVLFRALPMRWVLRRYQAASAPSLDDTATIMFSSGSTGIPKGVVLSHANILSNILGLMQVFDLGKTDRMLGVLPFFHSFGFTATIWYPLIAGFGCVYHVNPLDAKVIGELAGKYKGTVLLATPTFLAAYTRKCTPEQFKHLRYVITGAERLRESVARAFEEKFGQAPLEGYGCTELSPVATVNVPNVSMGEINQVGTKAGKIGHPIPGVSVRIVHPDTFEPVPQGTQGLLLVKGPNVMRGYLGEPEKTAEAIREGWYVTGDIAMVDHDGFVQIMDRLARFSKIGGEMVPHVMIEETINQLAGGAEPAFVVTSVPDEKRGEQLVVLYARTEDPGLRTEAEPNPRSVLSPPHSVLDVDDLYRRLQESNLPKLWIPARDRFFPIEALPYLGTGKLDLSRLREKARQCLAAGQGPSGG